VVACSVFRGCDVLGVPCDVPWLVWQHILALLPIASLGGGSPSDLLDDVRFRVAPAELAINQYVACCSILLLCFTSKQRLIGF
jgi:hypothetical protein